MIFIKIFTFNYSIIYYILILIIILIKYTFNLAPFLSKTNINIQTLTFQRSTQFFIEIKKKLFVLLAKIVINSI